MRGGIVGMVTAAGARVTDLVSVMTDDVTRAMWRRRKRRRDRWIQAFNLRHAAPVAPLARHHIVPRGLASILKPMPQREPAQYLYSADLTLIYQRRVTSQALSKLRATYPLRNSGPVGYIPWDECEVARVHLTIASAHMLRLGEQRERLRNLYDTLYAERLAWHYIGYMLIEEHLMLLAGDYSEFHISRLAWQNVFQGRLSERLYSAEALEQLEDLAQREQREQREQAVNARYP